VQQDPAHTALQIQKPEEPPLRPSCDVVAYDQVWLGAQPRSEEDAQRDPNMLTIREDDVELFEPSHCSSDVT
jgi:hypothetical protein